MILSMIKLEKVGKTYQIDKEVIFTALEKSDLTIKPGEFSAIIGPSGSGKSTLMHLIGLLDKSTSGKIIIEGKDISTLNDNETSRLRNEFVGFVFQQFNLINKLTVLENILLPSIYNSRELNYDPNQYARSLIERFGLKGKEKSFPNKISGGEQQRVAIARALIMKPKLILADEPTGNLDSKTGNEIINLLKDLNKKDGMTVIIVTHEENVANETRRKIFLRDGKIIKS